MFGATDAYLTAKIIVKWTHFTEAEVAGSDCSEDEIFSSQPEATHEIFFSCCVDQKPLSVANVSEVCLIWQFRRTKISLPGTTVIISFICYLRSSYQRWWRLQPSGIWWLVRWYLGYCLLTSLGAACSLQFQTVQQDSAVHPSQRNRVMLTTDGESFSASISLSGCWVPPKIYDKYWQVIYKCRVTEFCGTLSSDRTSMSLVVRHNICLLFTLKISRL